MSNLKFTVTAHTTKLFWLACLLCLLQVAVSAWAANSARKTPEEAVAMVKKAIAHIQKLGQEKAFVDINNQAGPFVDGDLYVIVFNVKTNICVAHGAYPMLIGKNMSNKSDPDGVIPAVEFIRVANSPEARGWVEYRWPHPQHMRIERKKVYVERIGDLVVAAGISNEPHK